MAPRKKKEEISDNELIRVVNKGAETTLYLSPYETSNWKISVGASNANRSGPWSEELDYCRVGKCFMPLKSKPFYLEITMDKDQLSDAWTDWKTLICGSCALKVPVYYRVLFIQAKGNINNVALAGDTTVSERPDILDWLNGATADEANQKKAKKPTGLPSNHAAVVQQDEEVILPALKVQRSEAYTAQYGPDNKPRVKFSKTDQQTTELLSFLHVPALSSSTNAPQGTDKRSLSEIEEDEHEEADGEDNVGEAGSAAPKKSAKKAKK